MLDHNSITYPKWLNAMLHCFFCSSVSKVLSSPQPSAVVELFDLIIFGLYFELSLFKALSCEELEELDTDDSEIDRDACFNVVAILSLTPPSSTLR
jgi:hypothetical protein